MKKKCKIIIIVLIISILILTGIIVQNVCLSKKNSTKDNLFQTVEQYQELVEEGYKVKVKYVKEDKNNYYFKYKDNTYEVNKKTGEIVICTESVNVVKPE